MSHISHVDGDPLGAIELQIQFGIIALREFQLNGNNLACAKCRYDRSMRTVSNLTDSLLAGDLLGLSELKAALAAQDTFEFARLAAKYFALETVDLTSASGYRAFDRSEAIDHQHEGWKGRRLRYLPDQLRDLGHQFFKNLDFSDSPIRFGKASLVRSGLGPPTIQMEPGATPARWIMTGSGPFLLPQGELPIPVGRFLFNSSDSVEDTVPSVSTIFFKSDLANGGAVGDCYSTGPSKVRCKKEISRYKNGSSKHWRVEGFDTIRPGAENERKLRLAELNILAHCCALVAGGEVGVTTTRLQVAT